ncbi:CinA family protein [Pseudarthrobacter sp. J75]|uniref:CinA family protein n=1 Tax=unclassified Pseudarthrobacter TaxID=2647000 RepID=UPI002E801D03|nr:MULTISPECIES: CinA family protein [unclassified Pseudarthrobacter]MEE2521828.1 CinA family protein [Pseudarthrobacter sp. J47]MEE2527905.1 CinA family protein [Pseudarthrobacter sp. J75]
MSKLHEVAAEVVRAALDAGVTVGTAESLTAGLVSASLADIPGASGMLQGGVVAYQNSVKADVLGVPEDLLERVGSVDGAVAAAMASGARKACGAGLGVSTTGVAGPETHDGKAVGTVFIGIAGEHGEKSFEYAFTGGRAAIRSQACQAALERLLAEIESLLYQR